MFRNYLKTAWRNLWKTKIYSSINVIGLAIGMAACIIILLFVFYEWSFDKFHSKNIYRLNEVQKFEGMVASQKVALSMFPMGPTLKKEFPEIINFTRINRNGKVPFDYAGKKVYIKDLLFVDSTFLDMFDFELLEGDRKTALDQPKSIILTKTQASKYFGSGDAIGKTITNYGNDTTALIVTGIMKDVPQNSQLQFDAVISFSTIYRPDWNKNWGGNWLNTFLELAPGTDLAKLSKGFPGYLKKYLKADDNWKNYELFLVPLRDVHSKTTDIGLDNVNYQKFDNKNTKIFLIISLIVLLIAIVNFMNLSTARSSERAREVGIRKTLGAYRWQLSVQFIGESIILSFIALVIAVILVLLFLPTVNQLSQRTLQFPIFTNWKLLLLLLTGTVVLGTLAGIYPARFLSSFLPVKVLKGSSTTSSGRSILRNVLVITQFASAIFLIIATVFAVKQLRFMRNKSTGFNREQVVTVPLDDASGKKYGILKKELLQNTLVEGVTASQDVLGSHLDQSGIDFKGDGPARNLTSTRLIVDPDFLSLYKIPLIAGRNFLNDRSSNGKEYIINQGLAKELLKDNPKAPIASLLGKQFGFDSLGRIVGIAKDFNFNSLHHPIETMFMFSQTDWGYSNMSIKINGSRNKEAVSFIESTWKKNCVDIPFEYQFLDEHFEELYRADLQISSIVGALAALAIIVACLGLFGLASYSAERRTKEVGIRKVLGASLQNIVVSLSTNFLKWVGLAALIACPLSWLAVHKWLEEYAYRTPVNWYIFLGAVLIAIAIAFLTISVHTIRAGMANPVKSLRTE